MARKVAPVGEAEAGKEGVQEAITVVMGEEFKTYVRIETQDDLDEKISSDVVTLQFAYPELISLYGDPEDNDKVTGTTWRYSFAEIDLGKKNRDAFLKAIEPYVKASREIESETQKAGIVRARSRSATHDDTVKIREWAKQVGHKVNDRGRIPADIREAYYRAHTDEKK